MWKLTLSYTAVTVGSLLIVVLILGYLLFSSIFIPLDFIDRELSPRDWIRMIEENSSHIWRPVLKQDPIDLELVSALMKESNLQITSRDLLNIADFQISMRTVAQGSGFIIGSDGTLLGIYNSNLVREDAVGKPLDFGILPGLEKSMKAALRGEDDPEQLFVTLEPYERFYFSIPILDEADQEVLGVALIYIEHLPTANDIPITMWALVGRSVLIFLLAMGVVGTIFGAMTASGMVSRLGRVSQVTDAWSKGDFSDFIEDPTGDEISQLTVSLNHMAEQLQQFLKRSQELAVSEERNRLARDLHDSAKQEALAASLHLGTALTLFESDPESAKNHVVEADSLVDSVRGELTDLIHELRPPSMNGTRFDDTINEYMIDWAHQTGIEATLNVKGFIDLPLEIKQAIYRIMQESLANVARHSNAKKVEVTMDFEDHSVEFCISDDGIGFDIQLPHDGMGLDSMQERVVSLRGDFSIESDSGRGTKICLRIPIA
jgi:NarL family two-component system sensor histidine kinase LiaS